MKANTMEIEAFETAIKDYTTKVVNPDTGMIKYELIRKPKTMTYALGGHRIVNPTKEHKDYYYYEKD